MAFGLLPRPASAQGVRTFKGEFHSINFATSWDTVKTNAIIAKYQGLGGMATLGASESNALPDIDSLLKAYKDSLGGDIRRDPDSAGIKVIGKYQIHWQNFNYDSLPRLSQSITAATGIQTTLKKGRFRVYYLNAEGISFSVAVMAIISGGTIPYADVEAALVTLKLNSKTGIRFVSMARAGDVWFRSGVLGGAYLRTMRVHAVECFDSRGRLIGMAVHGPEGTWIVPFPGKGEYFLRLRVSNGNAVYLAVR